MNTIPDLEVFYKKNDLSFFRNDHIGTFMFNVICFHCKTCEPTCAPYSGRHAHPTDFGPDSFYPFDRVIRLVCSQCNYANMRFIVHDDT